MGRRSRSRVRAGLQSPKVTRDDGRHAASESIGGSALANEIELQFSEALRMFHRGEGALAFHEIANLARWWSEGIGCVEGVTRPLVPETLRSYLCEEIEGAWERGWQPADMQRVVRRMLPGDHAALVVDAIASQAESYRSRRRTLPSWMDQLDRIGANVRWAPETDHLALFAEDHGLDLEGLLRAGLTLLIVIFNLPELPRLDPPPSEWDTSAALDAALAWRKKEKGGQRRHLERVRALLAKAESTQFEEEAEALTEKAQELMTRYAIDEALLAAHSAGKLSGPEPRGVRIGIDDPYSQPKAILLTKIAQACGCRAVWTSAFGFVTVFGFDSELKSVDVLYTSLLLQASKALARAGQQDKHARTRSFRQAFLVGFAIRIGERLEESARAVVSEVSTEQGVALVPVLAERLRMVEDRTKEAFPEVKVHRLSGSNWSGWISGTAAADGAEIARGPLLGQTVTDDKQAVS